MRVFGVFLIWKSRQAQSSNKFYISSEYYATFMKKRGQVAMEFLMTYGWAIIIILLAIAALWLLGVFNFDAPSKCTMTAPFNCNDVAILDNAVLLKIAVTQAQTAKITKITVNGETCPTIFNADLTSDIVNTVICKGIT